MVKQSHTKFLWITAVVLCGAVVFGWWWQANIRQGKYKDLLTAFYIMGVVKLNYYQPVSLVHLMKTYWEKGDIGAMLKTLKDPYTRFLNRNEFNELQNDTKGAFGGIGVYLIPKEEELFISKVVEDTPGQKAGLQEGDRIIAIGKIPVKEMSTDVAIAKIRGVIGSFVSLRILRGEGRDRQDINFRVKREKIKVQTVSLDFKEDLLIGKYAFIKISQFAETTPVDLEKSMRKIDRTLGCKALVLDLRANPGGSLDAAIKVASEFLPANTPVIHVKRPHFPLQTLSTEYYVHKQLPMAVLVDNWSASASEIVSGALKDQKRAILVGTRTFGKDLIQEVKELPGNTALTITIASYLTSGKKNIHKIGVQPDKVVEIPGAFDRLLKQGDPGPFKSMYKLQEEEALKLLRLKVLPQMDRIAS